jgi:hypothetical protein
MTPSASPNLKSPTTTLYRNEQRRSCISGSPTVNSTGTRDAETLPLAMLMVIREFILVDGTIFELKVVSTAPVSSSSVT